MTRFLFHRLWQSALVLGLMSFAVYSLIGLMPGDPVDLMITAVLGPDFPYFASIGNHDEVKWPAYQAALLDRLARIKDAYCVGNLGVKSACWFCWQPAKVGHFC